MSKSVGDAFAKDFADFASHLGRNVLADDVSAKGKRQLTRALPPFSEIEDGGKAFLFLGKLAFVYDQAGVGLA